MTLSEVLFTCEKSEKKSKNSGLGRIKLAYAFSLVNLPKTLDN